MRTASVRDLRYRFPEVESLLAAGQEIAITKRKKLIARLVPVQPGRQRKAPDFMARMKAIHGDKVLAVLGAELIAQERDRY